MSDSREIKSTAPIRLGLRENLPQFSLLVLVNALSERWWDWSARSYRCIAEQDFGLASKTAILSFIATFGIVKAFSNLLAGRLSDRLGRKKILVVGWLVGLPVPFMVIWAPTWNWIVLANVLLGINQGLCWSTTVIMKIDLVGPSRRGLAMGLNEFAGYLAVALTAFATGYIASVSGLRPQPFYLGIAFVLLGLLLSAFFVKETREYALQEGQLIGRHDSEFNKKTGSPSFAKILLVTSWKDRALFSCSQAGMINNLNDGMAWGLFPLLFASSGLRSERSDFSPPSTRLPGVSSNSGLER